MLTLGTAATWLDADSGGSFHPHGDRLPPVPTAHPAPHVLPVLLDAAVSGVDDRTLLGAFAAGTELGMRLGAGSSLRSGLHPHGIHGPAGAAVAAAVLRGGDAGSVGRAFARGAGLPLAALLAVPMGGGTVRNLWTGLGSYYGAMCGAVDEGPHQDDASLLLALFGGALCDELDLDVLMGVHDPWRLRSSYLKPYACARWIHPACDALRAVLAERPHRRVAAIEVATFAFAASLRGTAPASDMAARFSLPYSLATLVYDGRLAAPEFLPDRLHRPEVVALAERVAVREEPAFTAMLPVARPARVRVSFTDGSTGEATVSHARGNPDDPLPAQEVEAKLRANVGDLLPARQIDELSGWFGADPASGHLLGEVTNVLLRRLR